MLHRQKDLQGMALPGMAWDAVRNLWDTMVLHVCVYPSVFVWPNDCKLISR